MPKIDFGQSSAFSAFFILKPFSVQNLCDGFFFQAFAAAAVVVIVERDLRVAPGVEMSDLVNALNRAGRRTPFFGDVFAFHITMRVFVNRNSGRAALLRTPADDALF